MASSTRTPASLSELFRSITKPPTRQLPNTASDFIMMALILSCVLLHASPLCAAMKRAADGDDPNCDRSQRHCPGCGNVRAGGNNSSSASALAASTLVAELSDILPANAVTVNVKPSCVLDMERFLFLAINWLFSCSKNNLIYHVYCFSINIALPL